MPKFLKFSDFEKIYEQQTTVGTPIDFVISAGASKVPMSDEVLTKNQGYPLGTDPSTTNIYELPLITALAGNFKNAKIVGTVDKQSADTIEFNGKSISMSGKIEIEYNADTFSKHIKISGNGALTLARASAEFASIYNNDINSMKRANGVIVLELSAASLYSKSWSIQSLGLSFATLKAKLNGIVANATVNLLDKAGKDALVNAGKSINYPVDRLENNYAPSLNKTEANGTRTIVDIPNLPVNKSLSSNYNTYSAETLLSPKDIKTRFAIKKSIIDPGLDALANYIPTFLSDQLIGLTPNYINRMAISAKTNINHMKSIYKEPAIAAMINATLTGIQGTRVPTPASKTGTTDNTYKQGQS